MLPALIFIYVAFVLWKLTPVVFRALEIRKQFKADEAVRRLDALTCAAKIEWKATEKANDEYREHLKKVQESVGHGGRVQYPWVRRVFNDTETQKDLYKKSLKKLYEEGGP